MIRRPATSGPRYLLLVHRAHLRPARHGVGRVVHPGVADVAGEQGVALAGHVAGDRERVAVQALEVALAADLAELRAVPVVGERDHHVGAAAQELAVQLAHGVRVVEDDLGDVRAALQVAAALELEQVALGPEYGAESARRSLKRFMTRPSGSWWRRGRPAPRRRRRTACSAGTSTPPCARPGSRRRAGSASQAPKSCRLTRWKKARRWARRGLPRAPRGANSHSRDPAAIGGDRLDAMQDGVVADQVWGRRSGSASSGVAPHVLGRHRREGGQARPSVDRESGDLRAELRSVSGAERLKLRPGRCGTTGSRRRARGGSSSSGSTP